MYKITIFLSILLVVDTFHFTNFTQSNFPLSYANEFFKLTNISNVSENCTIQLKEYLDGLIKPELWALKMLDASSKLNPGLLETNFVNYGAFDECINIKEIVNGEKINGKYCLGYFFIPQKLNYNFFNMINQLDNQARPSGATVPFALCIPDICTENDVTNIMSFIGLTFTENAGYCQSSSTLPTLNVGDILLIILLISIGLITISSTAYGLYVEYKQIETNPIYTSFSLILNTRKLIAVKENSETLSCIHGLRVFSIMWIIYGHRFATFVSTGITNYKDLKEWMDSNRSMFILGATVSVDTFFVISGTVLAYTYMTAIANGNKFNLLNFYLSRYLRLTPALLIVIIINLTLLKFMGDGPIWDSYLNSQVNNCEKYWWATLLYIQNYIKPMELCIAQSWYLSTDFQFYILSPLVLLPLVKKAKLTLIGLLVLIISCMVITFTISWIKDLRAFPIDGDIEEYQKYYYFALYSRATPWIFGVLLGYTIFQVKQYDYQEYIKSINEKNTVKMTVLSLWILCLIILSLCVFTSHDLITEQKYEKWNHIFYLTLLRPIWALGISWIIFASVIGLGGVINSFLSMPLFQILARLTYSMYLVHMLVIVAVAGQIRQPEEFTFLNLTYKFCGDFVLTTLAAYFLCILFESPIINIQKYLTKKN